MKPILYIAGIISMITYSFWAIIKKETGIGIFYIGNALFISLILFYIYYSDKKSFIKFVLLELSIAYLIKEIIFELYTLKITSVLYANPSELTLQEALLIVIVPFIWYLREKQ